MKIAKLVMFTIIIGLILTIGITQARVTSSGSYESNRKEINRGLDLADSLAMPAFSNLSSNIPEILSMTLGVPVSPENLTIKHTKGFSYIDGDLVYNSEDSVYLNIAGSISMSSSINNVTLGSYLQLNDIIDSTTIMYNKIATGGDLGSMGINGAFLVGKGDKLNYFLSSDKDTDLTLESMNFTIYEVSKKP